MKPWPLLAALLFAPAPLFAVQIVDWGGGYVSADVPFENQISTSPQGGFTGGNPDLLSPTSNYSGPAFYGAVSWTSTGSDGNYGAIDDSGGSDRIEFKRYDTDLQGLVLFKQADFLGDLNTGNVGFDSSSTISLTVATLVNFSPGRAVIRIQGGSVPDGYYISQETPFDGTGAQDATFTSLNWYAYDPADGDGLTPADASLVNLVEGGLIEHVTEVGFYARSNNASAANAFRVSGVDIDAIAIPEPSAAGLVALAALGLVAIRRRHV